jgi:hypothetical protein
MVNVDHLLHYRKTGNTINAYKLMAGLVLPVSDGYTRRRHAQSCEADGYMRPPLLWVVATQALTALSAEP